MKVVAEVEMQEVGATSVEAEQVEDDGEAVRRLLGHGLRGTLK